VRHTDGCLLRAARPCFTFSRISEALAVQINGLGSLLCCSKDALVGEISKKTFHHVEPGSVGRCEVHVEARMALKPALHSGVLVRRVVVSN